MKVTFLFDMSNPDDVVDYATYRQAPNMRSLLAEFAEELRQQAKYADNRDAAYWRSRLYDLAADRTVSWEDS